MTCLLHRIKRNESCKTSKLTVLMELRVYAVLAGGVESLSDRLPQEVL